MGTTALTYISKRIRVGSDATDCGSAFDLGPHMHVTTLAHALDVIQCLPDFTVVVPDDLLALELLVALGWDRADAVRHIDYARNGTSEARAAEALRELTAARA